MEATTKNTTVIDGYLELLSGLSTSHKLDLIAKLSNLVRRDLTDEKSSFKKSFGALDTEKTAEEIIAEIRNSRVSMRKIEPF